MDLLLLVVLGVVLAVGTWRGVEVYLDASRLPPAARRLRWALLGAVAPARYWWGARIDALLALPAAEQKALLARETAALGLAAADGQRCPLCGAEVPHAWTLDERGRLAIAPGPAMCPACDFRLDACRHCAHFMPGGPQAWHTSAWNQPDGTWGRCGFYKSTQPVDAVAPPDVAATLRRRGYDEIRGPLPIVDSMLRPDFCRAFRLEPRRLRNSGLRLPGPRRAALLRLLRSARS